MKANWFLCLIGGNGYWMLMTETDLFHGNLSPVHIQKSSLPMRREVVGRVRWFTTDEHLIDIWKHADGTIELRYCETDWSMERCMAGTITIETLSKAIHYLARSSRRKDRRWLVRMQFQNPNQHCVIPIRDHATAAQVRHLLQKAKQRAKSSPKDRGV